MRLFIKPPRVNNLSCKIIIGSFIYTTCDAILTEKLDEMGWDGIGWDGMGWDGMEWDGMG